MIDVYVAWAAESSEAQAKARYVETGSQLPEFHIKSCYEPDAAGCVE